MNLVRSMLSTKNVPKNFLAKSNKLGSTCLESTRSKLDGKCLKCVLHGVSEESKAYRLYDPIKMDVVFEENENWEWDK
ncbi:hypothetical protein CR513_14228, partial [Mucuna pruriens]